jgi:hypothetical protein
MHLALIRRGRGADGDTGPAHAVYFASYEATKHALGGNEGESHEHHPLAAGAQCSSTHMSEGVADPLQLLAVPPQPLPAMR